MRWCVVLHTYDWSNCDSQLKYSPYTNFEEVLKWHTPYSRVVVEASQLLCRVNQGRRVNSLQTHPLSTWLSTPLPCVISVIHPDPDLQYVIRFDSFSMSPVFGKASTYNSLKFYFSKLRTCSGFMMKTFHQFLLNLKAVYQLVLLIEISTESNSFRRADSDDVLEIRKSGQKTLLSRQNVILTWTSFPDRKQGGSSEKLKVFIEMKFSAAAIIDRTSVFVLENIAVPPRSRSLNDRPISTEGRCPAPQQLDSSEEHDSDGQHETMSAVLGMVSAFPNHCSSSLPESRLAQG
ncbi:hypothetical protein Y032_0611g639 [Ancylostoma ceylanicum]|uniref:Uncharacterized protein n=1 Tax=Ancylostoma ceylanicum TaxID=53326 RepID=A0A016WMH8_9BILA|nr:hypothetical protein Y032_0611g639 [Ancylostoma ceylanicum]